jgi:hypothetical protein
MSKNTKWEVKSTVDKVSIFGAKVALSSSAVGVLPTVTIRESTDNALSASFAPGGLLTLTLNPNNQYIRSIVHQIDVAVTGTGFTPLGVASGPSWVGVYSVCDGVLTAASGTWTCVIGQYASGTANAGGQAIGGTNVSSSLYGTNFVDGNAGLEIDFFAIMRDAVRPGKF